MTGNPTDPKGPAADGEEFVVEPTSHGHAPGTAPLSSAAEVFEAIEQELAERRSRWAQTEARLEAGEAAAEAEDEVFVIEEEGVDQDDAATAAPVRGRTAPEPFSADPGVFADTGAPPAAASRPDQTVDELAIVDDLDASDRELEIIAEQVDPFAAMAAAGQQDAARAAAAFESAAESAAEAWDDEPTTDLGTAASHTGRVQPATEPGGGSVPAYDFAMDEAAGPAGDEPVPEDDYDPIYGEPEVAEAEAELEPEPDYSTHEDTYAAAEPAPVVVGGPAAGGQRRIQRWAAAAALLVLGGGAALVAVKPELLRFEKAPPLVDRVPVARPTLELALAPPALPAEPAIAAAPAPTPPAPEPAPQPVVTEAPPAPTPVAVDPAPTPDPVASPVAVAPAPLDRPSQVVAPPQDSLPIGEDLQVRVADAPDPGRRHRLAEGVMMGNQAFAQLKNMNFFVGRVKAMDASYITLTLEPGEVTLSFDELTALVPLASEEYRLMQRGQDSFVRLRNSNRLFGRILAAGGIADNVVIEVQKNLVSIPRHSIEEIGAQNGLGLQVLEDGDTDWVQEMLKRRARASGTIVEPSPRPDSPRPGR